jgi:hypothetical protein
LREKGTQTDRQTDREGRGRERERERERTKRNSLKIRCVRFYKSFV